MDFYAPMFVGTGIILLLLLAVMAAPEIRAAQRKRRALLEEEEEYEHEDEGSEGEDVAPAEAPDAEEEVEEAAAKDSGTQ